VLVAVVGFLVWIRRSIPRLATAPSVQPRFRLRHNPVSSDIGISAAAGPAESQPKHGSRQPPHRQSQPSRFASLETYLGFAGRHRMLRHPTSSDDSSYDGDVSNIDMRNRQGECVDEWSLHDHDDLEGPGPTLLASPGTIPQQSIIDKHGIVQPMPVTSAGAPKLPATTIPSSGNSLSMKEGLPDDRERLYGSLRTYDDTNFEDDAWNFV
jgi:hypothetical protein